MEERKIIIDETTVNILTHLIAGPMMNINSNAQVLTGVAKDSGIFTTEQRHAMIMRDIIKIRAILNFLKYKSETSEPYGEGKQTSDFNI